VYKFGKKSLENLNTCHDDLITIAKEAILNSPIDFSITEGKRLITRQLELYSKGRKREGGEWVIVDKSKIVTNIDGVDKKGKHNYSPSLAFDICVYVKGKPELAYNKELLYYAGGVIMATAKRLYKEGKIQRELKHGADWDRDGNIYDHRFIDAPHFELI